MIPSALTYDARLVNAQSRNAAKVNWTLGSPQESIKVVADCSGVRTPCFYRAEMII